MHSQSTWDEVTHWKQCNDRLKALNFAFLNKTNKSQRSFTLDGWIE